MTRQRGVLTSGWVLYLAVAAAGQALPPADNRPTPQIDPHGPYAAVTAMVFGPDGQTLYTAGLDKVVRVWSPAQGRWVLNMSFRVPIGPGNAGSLNAMALSPDGRWLALGGRSPMRGEAGFREGGVMSESAGLSDEQMRDAGLIYLVDTRNPAGGKVLRGHRGEVRALTFAPRPPGLPPLLISAATERDGEKRFGGVRLWDVNTGQSLAAADALPGTARSIGLAVWTTGPQATDVRAAITWPAEGEGADSSLWVWEPGSDRQPLRAWKADRYTRTAVALAGEGHVLTGGLGGNNAGSLRRWDISRQDAVPGAAITFLGDGEADTYLPVALARIPRRDGPELAAVALQPDRRAASQDFRLALAEVSGAGAVRARIVLRGSDTTRLPVVAASTTHLAVAATRGHEIRLYRLNDLLQGQATPEAVLTGNSVPVRDAQFVSGGLFIRTSGADPAERVFDLSQRTLRVRGVNDAVDEEPGQRDQIEVNSERREVTYRPPGRAPVLVRLRDAAAVVTAVTVRPPAPNRRGLIAVAFTDTAVARTVVLLHDAADGRPLRYLEGHLRPVRALSFSASRPLLVSTGDDDTVCVWGLADLGQDIGQLAGLSVYPRGKQVLVGHVEPGSAAGRAGLARGDVIEKLAVAGSEAAPLADLGAYLRTVISRQPGETVTLTVATKGVVRIPVERGADQRKPLFSLMLLGDGRQTHWLGWNPAGPYDCSSPAAEAYLGWHTNTGNTAVPVSFVGAQAHRREYYREGILALLVNEVDLGRALEKWMQAHPEPPPRPALRLVPPAGSRAGEQAHHYVVTAAVPSVTVGINDDFDLKPEHVLAWRLVRGDGGIIDAAAAEHGGVLAPVRRRWTIPLDRIAWRRGDYDLRVALLTSKQGTEIASKTLTLDFHPPRPKLGVHLQGHAGATSAEQPFVSANDKAALDIRIDGPATQRLRLQFLHAVNGRPRTDMPSPREEAAAVTVTQPFTLAEGLNALTVRAINADAPAGQEENESTETTVWVSYRIPKELPPRFLDVRLEPDPELRREKGDEVWVVNQAEVTLTGRIQGEGTLVRAAWSAGGPEQSFLPPRESRTATFTIKPGPLPPGKPLTLKLTAKSHDSAETIWERRVLFLPPLPRVTLDALPAPDVTAEKIVVTGTVAGDSGAARLAFQITASDGTKRRAPAQLDPRSGKWKAELPLFPGGNSIEAVVSNPWRPERHTSPAFELRYRRPPVITNVPEKIEANETKRVPVTLTVTGLSDRPLREVRVDGKPVRYQIDKEEARGDARIWVVTVPEVFLSDGGRDLSSLALAAVSDEGVGPPATIRIVHLREPRLAIPRILSPTGDTTSPSPRVRVAVRVDSPLPLESVRISGGKVPVAVDISKATQEGGRFVLVSEADVELARGLNTLELVAINRDGPSPRARVVVSYLQSATLIEVERIEVRSERNEVVEQVDAVTDPQGRVRFGKPVAQNLVWVVGRVRWSDPKAPALDDPRLQVVATVRDCRQFPVVLEPRGAGAEANIRSFRVPLVLIDQTNEILLDIPTVSSQERSTTRFTLACTKPAKDQRLHVVIIALGAPEAARMKEQVLAALGVPRQDQPQQLQGAFSKNPPFELCVLYQVLVGEVDRGDIEAQLELVNQQIRLRKQENDRLNDIVLIYYQGQDFVAQGTHDRWLLTSSNLKYKDVPVQEFAIPCTSLLREAGAQLLLLNVKGHPGQTAAPDPARALIPGMGLMRYAFVQPNVTVGQEAPTLFGVLQDAFRQKSQVGELAQFVDDELSQKAPSFRSLTALDPPQRTRRISAPRQ